MREDILQEIPDSELPGLRDYYQVCPHAPYIFSFVNTSMKWKKKYPNDKYITFYAVHGDWQSDGTFIALMQLCSYDFLVFTKEESCQRLYDGLTKTNRFDYFGRRIKFYAVHRLHLNKIEQVIHDLKIRIDVINVCDVWWMPKEEAVNLTYEIPPEVYISKLTIEHIPVINEVWPHRHEGSEHFLETLRKAGGGYGVFLKSDNSIAAWIFKNQLGCLGILQTVEKHKCKGYGSLLSKILAKEVGEDGHNPLGTVLTHNKPSQIMFTKIGFRTLDRVTFFECVQQ